VKLLLSDERVDINKAKNNGVTQCYIACQKNGHVEIVKYQPTDITIDPNTQNIEMSIKFQFFNLKNNKIQNSTTNLLFWISSSFFFVFVDWGFIEINFFKKNVLRNEKKN